jgi:peroxiredoxin-like protein
MQPLHRYETALNWTGRRSGKLEAPGLPTLPSGSPPEFGGQAGEWTPEHFFVASANVCLMATFLAIAELSKVEVKDWSSSASGTVEKIEGQGWMFTAIDIEARVKVAKGSDVERAQRLVEKAERNCLVSKSMKTPVRVRAQVTAES